MTDRRFLLAFLAALLTATLASFGVYGMVSRPSAPHVPTRPVVVAAQDLAGGAALGRASLAVVQWPAASVPRGAVGTVDSLLGRVLRAALVRGVPVLGDQLAPVGARAGLEGEIAAGHRAMAVRVTEAAGAAGLVRADSRVDVLVALRDDLGGQGSVARVVMSDVRVLAVGSRAEQTGTDGRPLLGGATVSPIVTLEVTPAQAEQLAAVESQGTVQLVLRGYGSREDVESSGASARDVLGLPPLPSPAAAPVIVPVPAPLPAAAPAPTPAPARAGDDSLEVRVFRGGTATRQYFAPAPRTR